MFSVGIEKKVCNDEKKSRFKEYKDKLNWGS